MPPVTITEFDVQALVDSHLTWEEEKKVRQAMCGNPVLEAYYRQIMLQKKMLLSWWQNETAKKEGKTFPCDAAFLPQTVVLPGPPCADLERMHFPFRIIK